MKNFRNLHPNTQKVMVIVTGLLTIAVAHKWLTMEDQATIIAIVVAATTLFSPSGPTDPKAPTQ